VGQVLADEAGAAFRYEAVAPQDSFFDMSGAGGPILAEPGITTMRDVFVEETSYAQIRS
jgi:hypothetical protein